MSRNAIKLIVAVATATLTAMSVATPANASTVKTIQDTNIGTTLPLGHTLHTNEYIQSGHWRLVLDAGGNLIGIKTTTGQHCYAWGPAGANAYATYETSHHFVMRHSDGSVYKDLGSGTFSGTPNVSINNGNLAIGDNVIHGPGPNCTP